MSADAIAQKITSPVLPLTKLAASEKAHKKNKLPILIDLAKF